MNPFVLAILIGLGCAVFLIVAVIVFVSNWDKWFKRAAPFVKSQADKMEKVTEHWEKTFNEGEKKNVS